MSEYSTLHLLLAENGRLRKELEDKERVIENYRAIFGKNPQQEQKQEKPSLIDKILGHLPKWIYKMIFKEAEND